jgi:hypothetical protein
MPILGRDAQMAPAAPVATTTTTDTPQRLSWREIVLATLLMIGGFVLVVFVLETLLTDGKWLIEESKTTGDGASKVIESKKYSDTLPLAAVGVGAALFICGAFFGRLREITLPGGIVAKFGDAKKEIEEKVEQAVDAAAKNGEVAPEKVAAVKETASVDAKARFVDEFFTGRVGEVQLDSVVEQAIASAKQSV